MKCMNKNAIIYGFLKDALMRLKRHEEYDMTYATKDLWKALWAFPPMLKECFPLFSE